MSKSALRPAFLIFITIILALMLAILPLPPWAIWYRPEWVLLVLIYWGITMPDRVSVGIAWLVGIALDVLTGSLLGEHAIALTVSMYFVVKFNARIRSYPFWQQIMVVCVVMIIYKAMLFWVQGILGQLPETWKYALSLLTSIILWPWIYVLLRDWQRRLRIYRTS